jgi:hypothetical protein
MCLRIDILATKNGKIVVYMRNIAKRSLKRQIVGIFKKEFISNPTQSFPPKMKIMGSNMSQLLLQF